MVSTVRLYVDATYAIVVMATAGVIAGFATAAISSDTNRSLQVGLAMFAIVGMVLAVRLWRIRRQAPITPVVLPSTTPD